MSRSSGGAVDDMPGYWEQPFAHDFAETHPLAQLVAPRRIKARLGKLGLVAIGG
jgi:hypothetical protein